MAIQYLSDDANMADLVSQIHEDDKVSFNSFGHTRIEAVFDNRLFIIYRPQGLDGRKHKNPEILTTIKVRNFDCVSQGDPTVEIEDLRTGQRQLISLVPSRVFDYNLFMSVPPALRLRWDARVTGNGQVARSLSYAVLIKSKNRSDYYSFGVTYAETPNRFREMFPDCDYKPNHY